MRSPNLHPTAHTRLAPVVPACVALLSLTTALPAAPLPNGVAAGDATQTSAVLWARAGAPGPFRFDYSTDPAFTTLAGSAMTMVTDTLVPAKAAIANLSPGTRYYYRATDASGDVSTGRFRTPAPDTAYAGFHFGVSGDWRGEVAPYPAVRNAAAADLDLWVSLGDTIYADYPSPAVPAAQATTLAEFRRKHAEVYTPRAGLNTLADLRASAALLAMIDDHEVTNDFAGGAPAASDPRFAGTGGWGAINQTPLYRDGLRAFAEYHPIAEEIYSDPSDPRTAGRPRLMRVRSYGRDAMVVTVDARSFRDTELPAAAPTDADSIINFLTTSSTAPRTMLGPGPLADLEAALLAAQARGQTWKFILLPEPIQNLGFLGASDRYEGYAAERNALLRFLTLHAVRNVVFISADIHGTIVNNVGYQETLGGPNIPTGAFEITTGSVGFDAPFAPTVIALAAASGIPGFISPAAFAALTLPQREAYIQGVINGQLAYLGYDPIGLEGSDIDATLAGGLYTSTSTFGWTDFAIDRATQRLTVTTWGVPAYTAAQALADPAPIAALQPEIVSRFIVTPVGSACPADFDRSGEVNANDVSAYLNAWYGDVIAGTTTADFDRSGETNANDISAFINSWYGTIVGGC